MNRYHARIFNSKKPLAAMMACGFACAPVATLAAAAHGPTLWFMGSRLIFSDSRAQMDDIAVSITDAGLQKFLTKLGATISFQSGQRYIVVTGADRRTVTYTVGSNKYVVDGREQDAPFSAVEEDSEAYIPFFTLARALNIAPVQTGNDTVLQPQIADVDTQVDRGRTVVIFHGAANLKPQILSGAANKTVLRFTGTSSTLQAERELQTPGVSHMSIALSGTVRNPVTTVTFTNNKPMHLGFLPAPDATSSVLAIAPSNVQLHASAVPYQAPAPAVAHVVPRPPAAAAVQPAHVVAPLPPPPVQTAVVPAAPLAAAHAIAVTGIAESAAPDRFIIKLGVSGTPTYAWRILPDGRFYIDIPNAALTTPTRDEALQDPHVTALRLRSNGTPLAPNVRLALTLSQAPAVAVTTDANNIILTISGTRVSSVLRAGAGRVGQDQLVAQTAPLVVPAAPGLPASSNPAWKFAPVAARNNRLIVIDPGHGGSDSGAQHNGLTEKVLTLDIARRLRTMLIARGWQVKMTRDSDVDVYRPNDSAHDELQARCDIANQAGARMFVSIHINSYTSSDLQGTTTYYYRPQDATFASAVETKMIGALGTQNDGIQHANFYVIHHTTMPAILVETAFLSNPDDAARLRSDTFRQSVASSITDGITAYSGGPNTIPQTTNDDSGIGSSYAAPVRSAKARADLVRTSRLMDDDLSQ